MPFALPHRSVRWTLLLGCGALAACGGGGSGVGSAPTPAPLPTPAASGPAPSLTPVPASAFDTAEFHASDGPKAHGAVTAYQAGASGAGVTVGIIDSGIASANPEFSGRISAASRDFGGNGSYQDEDGHGTAVATVLAGARNDRLVMGMAWNATVLALRADTAGSCATERAGDDDSGCKFDSSAIAQALNHARASGARVVNISLGGEDSAPTLIAAVSRAAAAGMVIIVAAGNDGAAAPDGFASSLAEAGAGQVIIAGSVDAGGAHSSFSNGAQGREQVVLSAVGEDVLSQDERGVNYLWSGTSFSAPQIAGAAALLAQAFPNLTGAQIVQLLLGSATDAGAAGADAVFGRGILNVARAFAPSGTTSLAGSATPVSLRDNGTLSTAMGDAAEQGGTNAVALDSLGRAYSVDLKPTIRGAMPGLMLAPSLQMRQRSVSAESDALAIAMRIVPGRGSAAEARQLMLTPQDAEQARLLSGSITSRLGARTTVSLGFSQGAAGLDARMAGAARPAFLIASGPAETPGFNRSAAQSVALRHEIGAGIALSASAERGGIARMWSDDPRRERDDPYASFGLGIERSRGPLRLAVGATMLNERRTLLGARFGPAIGTQAGRSHFLDLGAGFDAGSGWTLDAALRQGRTSSGAARLRSNGWALGLTKQAIAHPTDSLALRLSQPLRVEAGGLSLRLPTRYDYATHSVDWTVERLGLAPRGRQIDAEAVYARALGAGWMTTNVYWRKDSGNIAWFPDDIGAAMRFTLGF